MKIAQVAPLYEAVPPIWYGGTERVVSYLTEELIRQGHDVTLFASGESVSAARIVSPVRRALRLDSACIDPLAHHYVMLEQVFRASHQFDLIHFHIDYLHFPVTRRHRIPNVTTLHGRLDIADLRPLYDEFHDMPVISISDAQRRSLPQVNWQSTVYHGLPPELYTLNERPEEYLAFLGRVSPEKRLDRAFAIARQVGMKLKVAAKVDKSDKEYFDGVIKPLLAESRSFVEFIGEIRDTEKNEFLGNAAALLFPIDWPEPFGLVMIEAMACGTPVIAARRGSVPEVITDGVTGFVYDSMDEAVAAVERLKTFDRKQCRAAFESRFCVSRMASEYVAVYRRLVEAPGKHARRGRRTDGRDYPSQRTVLHPGHGVTGR